MAFVTVSVATLLSVPLDFDGNCERIKQSIRLAKEAHASIRTGPELEICGYGCLDHFHEAETSKFSWEVLADIISDPACKDMLIDLGLPVRHRGVMYNCRAICTYRHVFAIRPKMALANDGLYREARYFTAFARPRQLEKYQLEEVVRKVTGQHEVPFGDGIINCLDTEISIELCEELFTPLNPSAAAGLAGAEIFLNASASIAQLRKLRLRLELIANSTRKLGGLYLYANSSGVDGEARQMFDGSSLIIMNGSVRAQGKQFSLKEVEVTTASCDIEEVRSFRSIASRNVQAAAQPEYPRIKTNMRLSRSLDEFYKLSNELTISEEISLLIQDPMKEIHLSTGLFLWQYLTRTRSAGYLLPLSGGADSCTTALMVYGMAKLVFESIQVSKVLGDLRMVTGEPDFTPKDPKEIVGRLFHTAYMGTVNSGKETRARAAELAKTIGSYHSDMNIDNAVNGIHNVIETTLDFKPKYAVHGGSTAENLALQNYQARLRMVTAYGLAQLSTTARKLPRAGVSLLVLGSANVDECLRGYLTKYDCSSSDINPLGSISKADVRAFQQYAMDAWNLPILRQFIDAIPSAELIPLNENSVQSDEQEMGITYSDLSTFGLLRKVRKLGPYGCYQHLLLEWKDTRTPEETARTVEHFFRTYAMNRHKQTVATPSLHLSAYNPDDNRHDLRPFLISIQWPYQFRAIREHVESLKQRALENGP